MGILGAVVLLLHTSTNTHVRGAPPAQPHSLSPCPPFFFLLSNFPFGLPPPPSLSWQVFSGLCGVEGVPALVPAPKGMTHREPNGGRPSRKALQKFGQVPLGAEKRELVVSRFTLLGHSSPHAGKSGPFLLHGGVSTCKGVSTPRVSGLKGLQAKWGKGGWWWSGCKRMASWDGPLTLCKHELGLVLRLAESSSRVCRLLASKVVGAVFRGQMPDGRRGENDWVLGPPGGPVSTLPGSAS
jgi:hypothetical protein